MDEFSSPVPSVVLASSSPRRRELLTSLLGDCVIVEPPPEGFVEDAFRDVTSFSELGRRLESLAVAKNDVVRARSTTSGTPFLSADTVVVVEEEGRPLVLGKPNEDDYEASVFDTLRRLSGRTHAVMTGVCVVDDRAAPNAAGAMRVTTTTTRVSFRPLSDADIAWYASTGEPRGKAGAYAIQGLGSLFVDKIEGSLTNVIGLPLEAVRRSLSL